MSNKFSSSDTREENEGGEIDLMAQIAAVGVGVHRTVKGWPMQAIAVAGAEIVIEPFQAREIANALQTLAEKIIRRAAVVEEERATMGVLRESGRKR
jgi:hypothetical protein